MTLYTQRTLNNTKTIILMTTFFIVVIGIGWGISWFYNNPSILYIAVGFSVIMNLASYFYSDKLVLAMHRAHPVDLNSHRELYRTLENLSLTAGVPMPKFYLINDPSPNAFATGRDAKHAVVCVTSGLLEILDKTELEGVLAHELSHIGNKDMLVSTVAVILVGFVSILSDMFMRSLWFSGDNNERRGHPAIFIVAILLSIIAPILASLIHLAISRRREFLADTCGALLTRYPAGLSSALEKIATYSRHMITATNATAHLFFENPFGADKKNKKTPWIIKIFSTHPPVEERIKALTEVRI